MPVSAFVRACQQFGAGGVWLPGTPGGVAIDVSGYGRHAIPGSVAAGAAWSAYAPDTRPGYDGVVGNLNPYVATIPAITDANTLVAHVNVPTTSESGVFLILTNNSTRGLAMGVGNGGSMDGSSPGNTFMALNETVTWYSSGAAIPVGWHLFCFTHTAAGGAGVVWYIDGAGVGSGAAANLNAGTVTEAHVAGYGHANNRSTSCVVGITAWFPSTLSAGQVKHLATCSRRDRMF